VPNSPHQNSQVSSPHKSPAKVRSIFAAIARWLFLVLSLDIAVLSLLITFKAPIWLL